MEKTGTNFRRPTDEATLRGVLVAVIKETIPNMKTLREKEWAMRQMEHLTDNKLTGGKRLIKNSGVVRRVDSLGRVVIPKELRRSLGWSERSALEMSLDDSSGMIVIELCNHACHFCDSDIDITNFRDKNVCEKCLGELFRN